MRTHSGSGVAASCADSWKLRLKRQASVARSSRSVGTSMQKSEGAGEHKKTQFACPKRLHLDSNSSEEDRKLS